MDALIKTNFERYESPSLLEPAHFSFSMISTASVCSVKAVDPLQLERERQSMRDEMTRSVSQLLESSQVVTNSVESKDVVLVVWSPRHNHYQIYHEGATYYFVHSQSVEEMGLPVDGREQKGVRAAVLRKEYCQAKKEENRYRLPKGTHFYRVSCCQPQQLEAKLKTLSEEEKRHRARQ